VFERTSPLPERRRQTPLEQFLEPVRRPSAPALLLLPQWSATREWNLDVETGAQPEMATSTLVDSTPFSKREAMFGYEREGTRKRTVIYAARDGHSLAAARGVPMPSNAPKP
jgi:hypothetical protein